MTYPFKNIALNRNRKIIAFANPSADITQMVAKAVAGVADNYRGVWDTSGTYTNGEMVLYSNVMWLCLASKTTATPVTNSTVWQPIGSYNAFQGAWSSSTAYVVGDEVTYGGNFYVCTAANTNKTPSASSGYWQIAGPSNLDDVPDGTTYTKTLGSVQTGNVPDLGKGILGKHLGNIADDLAASGRSAHVVGTLTSRPAAGTAGRTYLATNAGTQGILYRDTGTAWVEAGVGHLADINGTTDNVTEGTNKFAAEHGADITGAHTSALTASLSNQSQSALADDANAKMLRFGTLAGRPAAGTAGRIYHASDAGTNGITYRDTGSAWVEMAVGHLADINGTTDNVTEGTNKFAAEHGADITGAHTSALTASLSNQDQSKLADDPAGVWLRFKGTQQTAILTNQASNHILDPGFTSIADFWGNVNSASAGVLNQGTLAAGGSVGNFNYDGRGTAVKVKLDPGDTLVLQLTSTQAPTGTATTYLGAIFYTAAGALISYSNNAVVPATGTGTVTSVTTAPATCAYANLYIQTYGNASGGNAALVTSPQARINHETVGDANALKAYVNASDTTSGGHTGTWQHSFMSSGVQAAIASSGSIVNVCSALNNTEQGTAFDGSAVTFLTAFPAGTSPIIVYLPGGLTYDSTLPAGSQQQAFSVTSLSNTGFTPVLKIQNIPATPTNQSVNFTPYNTATNSATATLSVPGGTVIINGAMTVNFSVTLPADSSDTVTITVAGTQEWSKNLVTGSSGKTFTYSIPVTNTAAVNGSTVVVADNVGISGVKATTVTYQTGTAATTHSATPAGANGVPFIVLPPPT